MVKNQVAAQKKSHAAAAVALAVLAPRPLPKPSSKAATPSKLRPCSTSPAANSYATDAARNTAGVQGRVTLPLRQRSRGDNGNTVGGGGQSSLVEDKTSSQVKLSMRQKWQRAQQWQPGNHYPSQSNPKSRQQLEWEQQQQLAAMHQKQLEGLRQQPQEVIDPQLSYHLLLRRLKYAEQLKEFDKQIHDYFRWSSDFRSKSSFLQCEHYDQWLRKRNKFWQPRPSSQSREDQEDQQYHRAQSRSQADFTQLSCGSSEQPSGFQRSHSRDWDFTPLDGLDYVHPKEVDAAITRSRAQLSSSINMEIDPCKAAALLEESKHNVQTLLSLLDRIDALQGIYERYERYWYNQIQHRDTWIPSEHLAAIQDLTIKTNHRAEEALAKTTGLFRMQNRQRALDKQYRELVGSEQPKVARSAY